MPAYFCEKTGVRIVKPGVSKSVDPVNGHDECLEIDGQIVLVSELGKQPAQATESAPSQSFASSKKNK